MKKPAAPAGPDEFLPDMVKFVLKMLGEKRSRALVDELFGAPKVEVREVDKP